MSTRLFLVSLSGVTALASTAIAADAVPSGKDVVVTATRVATPLEDVLPTTLVIDRDEIDRSLAGDAADLLRFHAGIDIARNGGPGQTVSVFMRGTDSNHTLVLVDGVRINPGTIGVPALQNLSPDLIERIEVVKGPRSSLYGTDAIGGVINVITRRGSEDGWNAQLGYGDHDTREASLTGGVGGGAGALDFGVSWSGSDGFPTRPAPPGTTLPDSGYDNLSVTAQGRTQLGSTDVSLRHWRAEGNTEYLDFFLAPVDQDYANSATTLAATLPAGAKSTLALSGSYFEDEIEQSQSPDFLRTERYALDAQYDRALGTHHALTAGVLYSDETAQSLSFGAGFDEDTEIWNVYAQDRMESGAHRLTLGAAYTDHSTFGDEVTWNGDYGYAFTDATELVLSAGSGFRAPDATDRYGFGGNPDLDPERSQSYSIELRHHAGLHTFRVAAFENDIEDLIEFVFIPDDPDFGENRNVDEARIRGIELGYEYASTVWALRADATFQDPENRKTGAQLLRRPKESYSVSVVRRFDRFDVGVDALATGEREDFGSPPVELGSYVLVNATAGVRLTDTLSLHARLENAFDEDYELASGYLTAGRGVYVSLRYSPGTGRR